MVARLFTTLAFTAGLLASSVAAFSPQDIPSDLPVSSLLTSAQTHLSKGETTEALAYYDAAIARDPSNYLTLFKRGATYLSLGRTHQATDDFNQVLVLEPGFEGAHIQLAKIKSRIADWEGARADFLAAHKTDEDAEIVDLEAAKSAADLARAAMDALKWGDCVDYASNAILIANRAAALREIRSHCRLQRGEIEEGLADLQHVVNLRPSDAGPHMVISATTFYGLGDIDNGMAQIRKCLHSDPDSKVCRKLLKQQKAIKKSLERVQGQLQKGQTATAGKALGGSGDDQGLANDINDQIKELRESGDIPETARSLLYEQVVEMTCQAFAESNHKNVDKYCDESLQLNPESFWAKFHHAKRLLRQEDFEASVRSLKELADAHPDKRDKINPLLQKADVLLRRSKTKDYYKVLGVANDADQRQIKSAYRKASKLFHPDKAHKQGLTKEVAEKKMAAINEAYEVLSDPELRARFDRGDDPNSQERQGNPFHGSPFGAGGNPFGGGSPFGNGQPFHFQFQQGGQRRSGGGGGGQGRGFF